MTLIIDMVIFRSKSQNVPLLTEFKRVLEFFHYPSDQM